MKKTLVCLILITVSIFLFTKTKHAEGAALILFIGSLCYLFSSKGHKITILKKE